MTGPPAEQTTLLTFLPARLSTQRVHGNAIKHAHHQSAQVFAWLQIFTDLQVSPQAYGYTVPTAPAWYPY